MIISLTGFMGCGKSSTGRALSHLTGMPLIDLDKKIEEARGKKIAEIFASEGEAAFRKTELEKLTEVISGAGDSGLILALGGGTFINDEARALILQHTRCVFLHASLEKIRCNIDGKTSGRPLFKDDSRTEELYNSRLPVYRLAPFHICMDNLSPKQAAEKIRRLLGCL